MVRINAKMRLPIEIWCIIIALCDHVVARPGNISPGGSPANSNSSSSSSTSASDLPNSAASSSSSGNGGIAPHHVIAGTTSSSLSTTVSTSTSASTSQCVLGRNGSCLPMPTGSVSCIRIRQGDCEETTLSTATPTSTSVCSRVKIGDCESTTDSSTSMTTTTGCDDTRDGCSSITSVTCSSDSTLVRGGICQATSVPCEKDDSCQATSSSSSTVNSTTNSSSSSTSTGCTDITSNFFGSTCMSYCGRIPTTVFVTQPFTLTQTTVVTLNGTFIPPAPFPTVTVEFPPLPCPVVSPVLSLASSSSSQLPFLTFSPTTTTILLTSKVIFTSFTTQSAPAFTGPSGGPKKPITDIETPVGGGVFGTPTTPAAPGNPPVNVPPATPVVGNPPPKKNAGPATITVGSVPVIIGPTAVIINSQTLGASAAPPVQVITASGQTFTVNPSQVVGGGVTLIRPPPPGPVVPTPTVVAGVPILVGPSSVAVIGGTSFTITPNAPQTSVVISGTTVNVGPGGIVIGSSTIPPAALFPTPAPDMSPVPIVEIIGGQTTTIEPVDNGNPVEPRFQIITAGHATITEVFMSSSTYAIFGGQTFLIGSMGASPAGPDITIPPDPSATTTVTAAGMTFAEIGGTAVVMGGKTYAIGSGATPTAVVVEGQTISFGPDGIGFSSTTLSFAEITSTSTSVLTLDGITFTEYGGTIAVIGGNTYRIGSGAWAVTEIVGGNTWEIGSSGVDIITGSTTLTKGTASQASETSTKKSGAVGFRWRTSDVALLVSFYAILGICLAL